MHPQIKFRGVNSLTGLRNLIVEHLAELGHEILITDTQVVLTQQSDTTPACRADILLTVPGPDIHASACDHTLLAAWLKVRSDVQHQIRARKTRQAVRHNRKAEVRGSSAQRPRKLARR